MILNSNQQDSRFFSANIALALRDTDAAIFIQQLHYWIQKGQGKLIDGVRWIHNSYKQWQEEQFKWFSTWQLRKVTGRLKNLGIIKIERHWAKTIWKQTNFYTLDYDRLAKYVKEKTGVTLEISELCVSTTRDEDCPQHEVRTAHNSYTKTNSIENIQREDPPSAPQINLEREDKNSVPLDKDLASEDLHASKIKEDEFSFSVESQKKEKSSQRVVHYREKIRQLPDISAGLWKSTEEFNLFYQALVSALPVVANARNADAIAKIVVADLCNGIPHSYWEDWKNGDAIGTKNKPEWEASPGIAHPMFVEYLAEYLRSDGDDVKTAKKRAYDYLAYPNKVRGLWREFKRDLEGVMVRVEAAEKIGVVPSVPTWFVPREEVTFKQATATAQKIQAATNSEDRLVLRHEVEKRERSLFAQSSFDRLMINLERELNEATKYGYEGQARKAIAHVEKSVETTEDLARLEKILQSLYPAGLNQISEVRKILKPDC